MAYGKMTSALLHRFVGTPGGSVGTTTQLGDIPMWFAAFSANPLTAPDPLTVEVLGATIVRPQAAWAAFGLTGLVNSADVEFLALPAGSHLAAVGLFDAEVNGTLMAADTLDTPLDFPVGGAWVLPAGEYFLGFDLVGL